MTDFEIAGLLWADKFTVKKEQVEAEKERKKREEKDTLLSKKPQ
jgi:hypothetical protein